jgi:hypothetical protein
MTFPPYYQVQQAKTDCYLPDSKMTVTIIYSEEEVQGIVDLTLSRLIENLEPLPGSDEAAMAFLARLKKITMKMMKNKKAKYCSKM